MAEAIWAGSGSAVSGTTPFGFYDNQLDFQTDADRVVTYCARRLGYPIMDVELQDLNFYTAFEEAITTYGNELYAYKVRENYLSIEGSPTASNLNHELITPNFASVVRYSEQYGEEAGTGGTVTWYTGSISQSAGVQDYNLKTWASESLGLGDTDSIEVKRIFYGNDPAIVKFFDPYAGTGTGMMNMMDTFGWGNYSPAVSFLMMPAYADLLRIQAIEFNDQIRKSAYTFQLRNNKLRIFPRPTKDFKLNFNYVKRSDRDSSTITEHSGSSDVISDFSNVPYNNMEYQYINHVGRQWIRKYGLALSKEMLGVVRGKYGTIPIPNAEVALDGDTLRSEASAEKEFLTTQLREMLDQTSRKAMLEADKDEAEFLQEKLKKVPYPIYIG